MIGKTEDTRDSKKLKLPNATKTEVCGVSRLHAS